MVARRISVAALLLVLSARGALFEVMRQPLDVAADLSFPFDAGATLGYLEGERSSRRSFGPVDPADCGSTSSDRLLHSVLSAPRAVARIRGIRGADMEEQQRMAHKLGGRLCEEQRHHPAHDGGVHL